MTRSTEALVIRCQIGDRTAFPELFAEWNPRVGRFLRGISSDPAAIDDMTQETWIRTVRSLPRLEDPGRFQAWIFTIARRVLADRLRRVYREPELVELSHGDEPQDAEADSLPQSWLLAEVLRSIPALEREALILHHLDGLPIAEVAAITEAPAGTVKSRLHRARRMARQEIVTREETS